ncbi:hypothetical protein pb186bvf_003970 [Paramecium bursaria]
MILNKLRYSSTLVKPAPTLTEAEQILQKLQSKYQFALSRDNYRIHLGLLIQRDPIFLKFTDVEMEYLKARYILEKKHNLIVRMPKEMYDFNLQNSKLEQTDDDIVTHLKQEGEKRTEYRENSKWFKFVDPKVNNHKSIQYGSCYTAYLILKQNERWFFPTIPMMDKQFFQQTKETLGAQINSLPWKVIQNKLIKVFYGKRNPRLCLKYDIEGQKHKGDKIFFFNGTHLEGQFALTKDYQDFAWVTRLDINKFFTKSDYESVIHALDL